MTNGICIVTPMGLKCSSSPVKSHNPGDTPCVVEDTREEILRRKAETQAALLYWMDQDWREPAWSTLPAHAAPAERAVYERARVIARVIELMYAAGVEDDMPFTVVTMGDARRTSI